MHRFDLQKKLVKLLRDVCRNPTLVGLFHENSFFIYLKCVCFITASYNSSIKSIEAEITALDSEISILKDYPEGHIKNQEHSLKEAKKISLVLDKKRLDEIKTIFFQTIITCALNLDLDLCVRSLLDLLGFCTKESVVDNCNRDQNQTVILLISNLLKKLVTHKLEKKPDMINLIDWEGVFRIVLDFHHDFIQYKESVDSEFPTFQNPFKVLQEMFTSLKNIPCKAALLDLMLEGLKNATNNPRSKEQAPDFVEAQQDSGILIPEFVSSLLESVQDTDPVDSALKFLADAKSSEDLSSRFIRDHFSSMDDSKRELLSFSD